MAAAARVKHLTMALESVHHGEHLLPAMQRAGVSSLATLLAAGATFAEGAVSQTDLAAFSTVLNAAFRPGDKVRFTSNDAHKRMLHAIVLSARSLLPAEGTALAAANAAVVSTIAAVAGPPSVTADTAKSVQAKTAVKLFTLASQVHGLHVSAHARVSYTKVAQLNAGNLDKSPVAFALSEYSLQLQVGSTKKEEFSFGDKKFVDVDGAAKEVAVTTMVALSEQMELRTQANIVAGCFDVMANAVARSDAPPTGDSIRTDSTIRYVVQNPTTLAFETAIMVCDATPAGQQIEILAMRAFLKRNPMVSLSRVINVVDGGIQQRIADYKMQGYTSDSAVWWACTKCPELYAPSLLDQDTPDKTDSAARAEGKAAKGRSADRSPSEREAALKRQVENQERQMANLKKGKGGGKGKGAWQGGGKGNGWQQPWAPPAMQWAAPGAPQPPGRFPTACPPDVCRDFNFKPTGCAQPAGQCRYKHICAVCAASHPHRGNH